MPEEKSRTFGYRQEVLDTMLKLLAPFDDITRDNMFGFPSFRASGQIFACIYEKGISLKMPKAAAEAIVQSPGISPFIPFGRARMRQWIYIERKKLPAYTKDFPLIEASIHYVRTLKSRTGAKKTGAASTPSKKKGTPKKAAASKTSASASPKASSTRPAQATKKTPAKTSARPKPLKKAPARKAAPSGKPAKKAPAKKSPPKKTAPKKAVPKKAAPKKAAPRKTAKPAKKAAPKRRR